MSGRIYLNLQTDQMRLHRGQEQQKENMIQSSGSKSGLTLSFALVSEQ